MKRISKRIRDKSLIIGFLITSMITFAQSHKISRSDFSHYLDCQQYDNWKTEKGDTLKIKKSFLFDEKGNIVRKVEEVLERAPFSKELTIYNYKNKFIANETHYKVTYMDDLFNSTQRIYFYNKNGLKDSVVVISSYPSFDFKLIEGTGDSMKLKNINEFDEFILKPFSEYIDSSVATHPVLTTVKDGKTMVVTGNRKVKKEASLQKIVIDTATTSKFYYNEKGKVIKEFFGFDGWNISHRTVINYDKKGRLSTVFCYIKNSYKEKSEARIDSLNLWSRAVHENPLRKEDAVEYVRKIMKEQMSDTLLEYNATIDYNENGSITETAVYSNRICKLTSYRNQQGQMVKTIKSNIYVNNAYKNAIFNPTDIKTLSISDFSFFETTSFYEYDSLGRIVKTVKKHVDNDHGGKKEHYEYENFTTYKYNGNRPLQIPESEYVDGYSNDHYFYSHRK